MENSLFKIPTRAARKRALGDKMEVSIYAKCVTIIRSWSLRNMKICFIKRFLWVRTLPRFGHRRAKVVLSTMWQGSHRCIMPFQEAQLLRTAPVETTKLQLPSSIGSVTYQVQIVIEALETNPFVVAHVAKVGHSDHQLSPIAQTIYLMVVTQEPDFKRNHQTDVPGNSTTYSPYWIALGYPCPCHNGYPVDRTSPYCAHVGNYGYRLGRPFRGRGVC